mmetsp:Transcript_27165/g.61391  ORF Transcript_27165/g.61391 Transcript_27165/m.61391 type:complete len:230 (+) Transcript_27165:244-933(+)
MKLREASWRRAEWAIRRSTQIRSTHMSSPHSLNPRAVRMLHTCALEMQVCQQHATLVPALSMCTTPRARQCTSTSYIALYRGYTYVRLAALSSFCRTVGVAHFEVQTTPPLTANVRSGKITSSPKASVASPPDSETQISPHAWSHVLRFSSYCTKPATRPAAHWKYLIMAPQQMVRNPAPASPNGMHSVLIFCGEISHGGASKPSSASPRSHPGSLESYSTDESPTAFQ